MIRFIAALILYGVGIVFCCFVAERIEDEGIETEETLRDRILWLSFRWQTLRDRADFLEWYGHDAGNLKDLIFDLQMEITRLKDELAGIEHPAIRAGCSRAEGITGVGKWESPGR